MRVTGGIARSLPLRAPGPATRPSMDAVRQAIFSSLAELVPGARVLDLFAGSGALGIEAASREAGSVVLVENDRRATRIIQQNLEKCRLTARVVTADVFRFLKRAADAGECYDLILADPPWAMRHEGEGLSETERLLQSPHLVTLLDPEGWLVLEESRTWEVPAPWQLQRVKRYGNTHLHYLTRSA